jgi:hypothetical protein
MHIELSEKDLTQLLSIIDLATGVVEYADDFIDSPQIAIRAREWKKVEAGILEQAHAQGLAEQVEHDEQGYHIADKVFVKNMEIMEEYDDLVLHQDLARNLARRDLFEHYSEAEIIKQSEKSGGYLGVIMHPFEEKYWKEFEEHEYSRLRIVE